MPRLSLRSAVCAALVLGGLTPASAQLTLSGDINTLNGVATLTLEQDITFTITQTGNVSGVNFVNWVETPDEALSRLSFRPWTNVISYRINGVDFQTTSFDLNLYDQPGVVMGDNSATDGMLSFGEPISVITGDSFTLLAGNWDLFGTMGFNPQALGTFTGDAFLHDNNSIALSSFSSLSAVPEPSTYAAIIGTFALVGAACTRRRRPPSPNAPTTVQTE